MTEITQEQIDQFVDSWTEMTQEQINQFVDALENARKNYDHATYRALATAFYDIQEQKNQVVHAMETAILNNDHEAIRANAAAFEYIPIVRSEAPNGQVFGNKMPNAELALTWRGVTAETVRVAVEAGADLTQGFGHMTNVGYSHVVQADLANKVGDKTVGEIFEQVGFNPEFDHGVYRPYDPTIQDVVASTLAYGSGKGWDDIGQKAEVFLAVSEAMNQQRAAAAEQEPPLATEAASDVQGPERAAGIGK